ncbi:hypothetical protein LCS82_09755 [Vibrio harveyi]|uniref:hypothetical protein n=1 Tax=Vibrio harveyi TaxID=669 RepID=UPI003BB61991
MKKWIVSLLLITGTAQASGLVLMNTIKKPESGKDFIQMVIFKDLSTKCQYIGEVDLWKEEVMLSQKVCQSEDELFVHMTEPVTFSADYKMLNQHKPLSVNTGDSGYEESILKGAQTEIQIQVLKSMMSGFIQGALDSSCGGFADRVTTLASKTVDDHLQCIRVANKIRTAAQQSAESVDIFNEIEDFMKKNDIPVLDLPENK